MVKLREFTKFQNYYGLKKLGTKLKQITIFKGYMLTLPHFNSKRKICNKFFLIY